MPALIERATKQIAASKSLSVNRMPAILSFARRIAYSAMSLRLALSGLNLVYQKQREKSPNPEHKAKRQSYPPIDRLVKHLADEHDCGACCSRDR